MVALDRLAGRRKRPGDLAFGIFRRQRVRVEQQGLRAIVKGRNLPQHAFGGIHHIYELFFVCERIGGAPAVSSENDAVQFFPVQALPELSTGRVLASQIERLHQHKLHPELPTDFD